MKNFRKALRQGVKLLGCAWIVVGPAFAPAQNGVVDLIVESRSAGQNNSAYEELEGSWLDSQSPPSVTKSTAPGLTPGNRCGTRKVLFHAMDEPDRRPQPAAVRFHARVPVAGRYHTYITWPTSANAVPIYMTIRHARGQERFEISQEGRSEAGLPSNGNSWISLGAYEFSPGQEHFVEMRVESDLHSASINFRGQVVADAVRFRTAPLDAGVLPFEAAKPKSPMFPWVTTLDEGRKQAANYRKKILLYFALPGSGVSKHLEGKVFANDATRLQLTRDYVPVKLNFADDTRLAASLGVYRGGTVVVYDPDGNALGKIHEADSPEDFLRRLGELPQGR